MPNISDMLCQQCAKKKHYLFLMITFFAESAGSKRVLFKVNLFTQNVGLLKRIHNHFFTIPFDEQRRNLLQKILFTQQEKVFANTDFIWMYCCTKRGPEFLGRDVISSSSASKAKEVSKSVSSATKDVLYINSLQRQQESFFLSF